MIGNSANEWSDTGVEYSDNPYGDNFADIYDEW